MKKTYEKIASGKTLENKTVKEEAMKSKQWIRKHRWVWISALILLLAALLFIPIYEAYQSISDPLAERQSNLREEALQLEKKEPFSVLLLGVDDDGEVRRNAGTIMVLTVNPAVQSIKLLHIPRETRVDIPGQDQPDKLNHAYKTGGVELMMETVEEFVDVPIDYFVKINMEGVEDVVDAMGGITVENEKAFSYEGYHFRKGRISLDGKQALAYIRMRQLNENGEEERHERQQKVIEEVIRKGADLQSLTHYDKIATALMNNVKTNFTIKEMFQIKKHFQAALQHLDSINMQGNAKKINGVYYDVIDDSEIKKISEILQKHLDY